jgi:3-hydroxyisobutyrate dehydrogenase-like beta-hydroxyacid dehydrogenase
MTEVTAEVTLLGLGAMGSRMARSLLKAGHRVTVWNRSAAAAEPLIAEGAIAAPSPREAARASQFVIAMLRDDGASRAVWLDPETGAFAGMDEGAVAIESSTLTVACMHELSRYAQAKGTAFLDAPVVGSRPQADAGALIYLVGGDAEVLARVMPLLRRMGGAVHHAGPAGSGAALKLAINTLFGIQVAALAELLGVLRRNGIECSQACDVIGQTPVCSPAAKGALASMLAGNFAPMFPVELVHKDFAYARRLAESSAARTPVADAASNVMAEAVSRGMGADNLTAVARLYA